MDKESYQAFWAPIPGQLNKHQCRHCAAKPRSKDVKHGYSNLLAHTIAEHRVVLESFRKTEFGGMDSFMPHVSTKAKILHAWVEWIIDGNLPLSICDNKNTLKKTNLELTTSKTITNLFHFC